MRAEDYFRAHEGVVRHMYLDTVGLVTVGVGFMLRSAPIAASYKFLTEFGQGALPSEIEDEWRRIKGMPFGMDKPAGFYRSACKLHLPATEIDRQLRQKLDDFRRGAVSIIPDFGKLSTERQTGVLDMVYSLGPFGWQSKYPKMIAAIKEKQWADAARECRRRGVSDTRNMECARLFDSEFAGWPD